MWHDLLLALAGGALIGAAAGLFMLGCGRIAGISGIMGEMTGPWPARWKQNIAFLIGLPLGLGLARLSVGLPQELHVSASPWLLALAGLLVGFGARLANGCTSGHGVCGLARLSPRSLAAVATFMGCAIAVVAVKGLLG